MDWFLEHAYVIPAIPAVSFVLILAIGRRLPFKGAEIGIVSICSSFVLACLTGVAWIQHVNAGGAHEGGGEGTEHAFGILGRVAEEAHHAIEPVVTASTWWQSSGVELTTVAQDSGKATFRVDALPASGGKAVLSRLNWPGYSTQGASLDDPLRGYLVQLDLNGSSVGSVITVEFQPPGWVAVVASMISALLLMIAWLTFHLWRHPRRRESPLD